MRRYIKKYLNGLLEELKTLQCSISQFTCAEYMSEIGAVQLEENAGRMEEILIECQSKAIFIGTKIEETEGQGTKTVAFLEQYCESVYQGNVASKNGNIVELKKQLEAMNFYVHYIFESIENEFHKDKIEVVFLPYKASMWDSLESIWVAANDDSECNASVIPIPYYDKNPDGSLNKMYYEGEEYPSTVPILDWRCVDLEKLHPDVIYFHNPYDNYNHVTSVHSNFYSSKLKKFTEMLVYIPYFVSDGDVPEHFCCTIGVFHANKVIVESEKVKETYKKVYIQTLGEKQRKAELAGATYNSQFWNILNRKADEKFLSLGSPKYDKISSTVLEFDRLPEGWKKIYNENGTKKKVVFYNTVIQALLDYKEKYLIKLENVLNTFEKNTDVVILWRPHPLLLTTIESMAKELLNKYQQIVDDFKVKGFGIYDDSADLNRTINISDSYYGDMSSVVALYKTTGKPIMIQSVMTLKERI